MFTNQRHLDLGNKNQHKCRLQQSRKVNKHVLNR